MPAPSEAPPSPVAGFLFPAAVAVSILAPRPVPQTNAAAWVETGPIPLTPQTTLPRLATGSLVCGSVALLSSAFLDAFQTRSTHVFKQPGLRILS